VLDILKNENAALQLSGGKDSLTCLFLTRPYWDRITVYWTNTGAAFPETIELMDKVRNMVPHFMEIRTNQPADLETNGWPVDVLPIRNIPSINQIYWKPRIKLQSFFGCCVTNIMAPMHQRMIDDGITLIIRGQRLQEKLKSTLRSGDSMDGFKVLFPIESWSGEQVRSYLADQEIQLPGNYEDMDTSLDCWSCTGYLEDNIGKRRYMKRNHPELYQAVSDRLIVIDQQTKGDLVYLKQALEA